MNIAIEIDADGVALATLDVTGRSMNTITYAVQDELGALAERVRTDDAIVGLVLRSGKASGFCAGADLGEMEGAIERWRDATTQDELRTGVKQAGNYSRQLRAIETCGKPVVAIVSGVALGGGLELALAAHRRIATGDLSNLRLGLPETTIGLMPGAGATQRLPRLIGIAKALPLLLDGTPVRHDDALASGIIHEMFDDGDDALRSARQWVRSKPPFAPAWDAKGYQMVEGPHSPAGYATLPYLLAAARGDGSRDHAARANVLRAVYEGSQVNIDAGLRIETRYFFNTVRSPDAGPMVRTLFAARQAMGRDGQGAAEALRQRIADAWLRAGGELVERGHSPALVRGVARSLSGKLPLVDAEPGAAASSFDLPKEDERLAIREHLLATGAEASRAALAEGLTADEGQTDVLAIQAGYPGSTGGPLSFLRRR